MVTLCVCACACVRVRLRVLDVRACACMRTGHGLLAKSQLHSELGTRPTRSRFSVVFLGPRANSELVPKFQVALPASHAALPMVALEISHCTNVTLQVGGVSDETVK
jgi:hypothetical protein